MDCDSGSSYVCYCILPRYQSRYPIGLVQIHSDGRSWGYLAGPTLGRLALLIPRQC